MISGTVVSGVERDVVVGMKAVVVSLVVVFFAVVGAAVVLMGAHVGEPGGLVELILGG